MRKAFRGTNKKFGIENDGALEYECLFETRTEAKEIAEAHDKGAKTYNEALEMVANQKIHLIKKNK